MMCTSSHEVLIFCVRVPFNRGYMDHSSEGLCHFAYSSLHVLFLSLLCQLPASFPCLSGAQAAIHLLTSIVNDTPNK